MMDIKYMTICDTCDKEKEIHQGEINDKVIFV
jgi:hypothetical protein